MYVHVFHMAGPAGDAGWDGVMDFANRAVHMARRIEVCGFEKA